MSEADKSVIVLTGASGYLGSHLMRKAFEREYKVVAIIRDKSSLEKINKEIKGSLERKRDSICIIEQDLMRINDFEDLAKRSYECFRRIDILINSAAIWDDTDPLKLDLDKWLSILKINLVVPYMLSISISKYMRNEGKIVNISCLSSTRGHKIYRVLKPSPPYVISKIGLNYVTKILAEILADKRIIVIGIAPSWVEKPELKRYEDYIKRETPLREAANPDVLSDLIYDLVEKSNIYMSGSIIEIPEAISG
ncbi:MAG: SDR family NAD(P)-dependent oxidoreductase [Desulfurococcaceae archaeon]|nr:SDR family NAD(P)-dependent oxidoreductase [Desulfurococcaceae archaeon]